MLSKDALFMLNKRGSYYIDIIYQIYALYGEWRGLQKCAEVRGREGGGHGKVISHL